MDVSNLLGLEQQSLYKIRQQIEYLRLNGMPGLLNGWTEKEEDDDGDLNECNNTSIHWTSGSTGGGAGCEVQVRLCYAGRRVTVQLLFSPRQPWQPPDLLISDTAFMSAITLNMLEQELGSLGDWGTGKEDSVWLLLNQLYSLYKRYQLAKLQNNNNELQNQYQMFIEDLNLTEDDLEVHINHGPAGAEVTLCVLLHAVFSDLPPALLAPEPASGSWSDPRCVLQFTSVKGSQPPCFTPVLLLCPRAEAVLEAGWAGQRLQLPKAPATPACSQLFLYAINVLDTINQRLKDIMLAFELRKQFIAQLLCRYDAAMVAHDALLFRSAELLLENKDFNYFVDLHLSHNFPKGGGVRAVLRAIEQDSKKPFTNEVPGKRRIINNSPDEIVQQLLAAITAYAPTFERLCREKQSDITPDDRPSSAAPSSSYFS